MATTTYGIYTGNRRKVQIGTPKNERIPGGGKKLDQVRTSGPVLGSSTKK